MPETMPMGSGHPADDCGRDGSSSAGWVSRPLPSKLRRERGRTSPSPRKRFEHSKRQHRTQLHLFACQQASKHYRVAASPGRHPSRARTSPGERLRPSLSAGRCLPADGRSRRGTPVGGLRARSRCRTCFRVPLEQPEKKLYAAVTAGSRRRVPMRSAVRR